MITLHIFKGVREWREFCLERDGDQCRAKFHASTCGKNILARLQVHHIVYKSHLSPRAHWIAENGITLSPDCHQGAHLTHNGNIHRERLRRAVDAVNFVESIPVKHFTKGKK